MEKVREIVREGKRVAKEDPRRVVHSFKVGLVLSLVSSFYYYQPLYDSFGVNAMWAVMTVVVVFEFSVGPFSHSKLEILLFRGLSFMIFNILEIKDWLITTIYVLHACHATHYSLQEIKFG